MKKLVTLALTGAFASTLLGGEPRPWTNTQGSTVTAEMVGLQNGKVLLKLESGKTVPFPLENLSPADQDFVRANAPVDTFTAAKEIDRLVMDKLKSSYAEIKKNWEAAKVGTKEKEELEFLVKMTWPTEKTSDEQFLRRIYLDVAGRIPTYAETTAFLNSRDAAKRSKLIDQLLESDAFTSNFFNFLSDLFRIREGISLNESRGIKVGAYADWMKDQIRKNRPWDQWVKEMLTAEGFYWDNPATGYMLTDQGMPLCNLSNNFTVFAGTEITCAQCHDHPFEEVFQMDFYKMAAFFGGANLRDGGKTPEAQAAVAALRGYEAQWKTENAKADRVPRFPQDLQDLLRAYQYSVSDAKEGKVQLPHDYKYDDAKPNEWVSPSTYFGSEVDLEKFENPRQAFATWLTAKDHPRFTINIVNRLWKQCFGLGQIEPVYNIPGHLDGQAQNYELLKYLEQLMKSLNYDIKGFLRVIYNTEAYQREANHHSPTLAQIDQGEYHFPSPVLRRMSAEQMWDSLVALTTETPELMTNRMLEPYREFMHTDWSKVTYEDLMKKKREEFRGLGAITGGGSDMMMMAGGGGGRRVDDLLVRASERRLPETVNHMMFTFGQSDKIIIQNANRMGSIPQVMFLLNGDLTNKTMVRPDIYITKNAKAAKSQSEAATVVYLSILNRKPNAAELTEAKNLVNGEDYSDLIWALLNSREFMFIQ
jgi:hypothetical protein